MAIQFAVTARLLCRGAEVTKNKYEPRVGGTVGFEFVRTERSASAPGSITVGPWRELPVTGFFFASAYNRSCLTCQCQGFGQNMGSNTPPQDLKFEAPTWTGLAAWNDTRFIRFTWVDISSVIRCKVLTLKHFRTLVSKSPDGVPTTTLGTASLGLVGLTLVDRFSVAGDYLFEVGLSSLRLLPYIPVMRWSLDD